MLRSSVIYIVRFVLVVGILAVLSYRADARQIPIAPVNLDFKQGKVGQEPSGWFVPPVVRNAGYQVKIVADTPQKGQNAAVLTSSAAANSANGQGGFGNLMQAFNAEKYRGKRVQFRAKVRYENGAQPGRTMLWMRVDRTDGKQGFFDNMADRPITSGEWKTYEITGEIEQDAQAVNIGLMLLGGGKAWIADASLTVLPSQIRPDEPPKPLTEQGRNNLIAFAKLYGYIRYFHPSDEAAKADWDKIAYTGVKLVEDAANAEELLQRLQALFRPIAPSVNIFLKPPDMQIFKAAVSDEILHTFDSKIQIVMWRHIGFGGSNIPVGQNIYASKREYADVLRGAIPKGFADPLEFVGINLPHGVGVWLPLSVYVQNKQTYPKATEKLPELFAPQSGNDRTTRLADIVIAWNVFQHFYPYFDVVKTDWAQVLTKALDAAAADKDERAFLDTLRRLVADLHDGHGYVSHLSDNAYSPPLFTVGRIEGKLVVTSVAEGAGRLKSGDILLKLNGQDAETVYERAAAFVSAATPQWRSHRTLSGFLTGEEGSSLEIEAQRGTVAPFIVKVNRTLTRPMQEPRPAKIAELKPGIWYVDMDARRAVTKDFLAALPKLEKAKGIVFDMRGYPNEMAMAVLPHLTDKPITSANWNVPIITQPDREKWEWQTSNWGQIPPLKPHLKAKIAFLTYGGAISYAESVMGIVEHYKLGAIVGEATAGTNGNVNPFKLPGGYQLSWTGMKVTKHKGSQHHGIGIQPTVPVVRTIKGVTAGHDEILEKAIEWLGQ